MTATIKEVRAREILDSRGNPTVEATIVLSDGAWGRAAVPSGASAGSHEALELRDGDSKRFGGKGVLKAIDNVEKILGPSVKGMSPMDQDKVDARLIEIDGAPNKSKLGANAVLAVSLAAAHAASASKKTPLYRHLAIGEKFTLPVPMFNILNGGVHAQDSTDIQEFMVIPAGLPTFREALRAGSEIYQSLKGLIGQKGFSANVGDEGGFAPSVPSNRAALELVLGAIEKAGYTPGREVHIALDVAATELEAEGRYRLKRDNITLGAGHLIDFYKNWAREFHIISIEDGLGEDDWEGWQLLSKQMGRQVQLVGDDLYTTNTERLAKGIETKASNSILLKVNQIGTLTETRQAFEMARRAGWGTVISHRSGETEDTTIADLAVAWSAGQIKAGAPCRSERVAKYNRLLRIEEDLGERARYAGMEAFGHVRKG
ncbi:MAG: phosphopyruvate hydratase [SAR202 cluster bacterium]|nr:phosphopyruvate hydratase [SAR202 cluster bacterium]